MHDVVIIPTYNERDNIISLVDEIFRVVPEIKILVVDDNSPDGTGDKVKEAMAKNPSLSLLERPLKDGLSRAYISGFKKVLENPEVRQIVMMDGDFSHDPDYLPQMLELGRNFGLVIGSRYVQGGGIDQWELWRRLLSKFANQYVSLILGHSIHDWTTGFNCIQADLLRKIELDGIDLSGYAFLQEIKFALLKAGAKVAELPIIFKARRGGESKMSGFIIWEGIIGPWKIKRRFNGN